MTTATKCALVGLGGGQLPETRKKGTQQMFHTSLSLLPLRLSLLVLACFHRPRTTCYGACPAPPTQMRARGNTGSPAGAAIVPRAMRTGVPPPRNRAGTPQEARELQKTACGGLLLTAGPFLSSQRLTTSVWGDSRVLRRHLMFGFV